VSTSVVVSSATVGRDFARVIDVDDTHGVKPLKGRLTALPPGEVAVPGVKSARKSQGKYENAQFLKSNGVARDSARDSGRRYFGRRGRTLDLSNVGAGHRFGAMN